MGTIRFLLALAVVIVHSSPILGIHLVPGYTAVESFYIISGFLMAMVFTKKYQKTERPYYLFITNRLLRLYPLYLIVIILTLMLSVVMGVTLHSYGKIQFYMDHYHSQPASLTSLVIVFISNFFMIGQDVISFFGISQQTGHFSFLGLQTELQLQDVLLIPIGWTIAVEFVFYLLAPFVSAAPIKKIMLWIGGVLLIRLALYVGGYATHGFIIYRFAPTEFFWFLLGILAYHLSLINLLPGRKWGILLLGFLIAFMISYTYIPFAYKDFVFLGCIFISCPALFSAFKESKTDKYLGDFCYPIYLSHCMMLLIINANSFPKPLGSGLPTLVSCLIFAVLVNKFIINPFEKYRQSRIIAEPIPLKVVV
ncbi:acyltransferase family protein [Chitinophagaceae bacterium MMS25-I14]